ncbi:Crp/Fnr family transcriptional regulator [Fulvivirgaceae bacterium BMA10]|uniref:Crp/Fnr family transcriptional regulator n=1 Tax=Splendidivirga corallicola TaxID=3051826 RepID=A0ABT8KWB4_9BACT|nr:Crp/Fnr family transcriptional regulator [Fulvivirgaceae bacterium BMA10]
MYTELMNQPYGNLELSFSLPSKINKLRTYFESTFYKQGQVVFNESNTPRGLYYIESGKVKIYKYGSDGKEQIIRIAKPGDFLGYRELLTNTRYTVSASILEDAVLAFVPKEDFNNLLREDADFTTFFTQLLSRDLAEAEEKMVALAYKPVRGRLAETLLELDKVFENENKKNLISLSREDLANIIGTAKETVIRLLSEFKSEKLININGRTIRVVDPNGLLRINNLYN